MKLNNIFIPSVFLLYIRYKHEKNLSDKLIPLERSQLIGMYPVSRHFL